MSKRNVKTGRFEKSAPEKTVTVDGIELSLEEWARFTEPWGEAQDRKEKEALDRWFLEKDGKSESKSAGKSESKSANSTAPLFDAKDHVSIPKCRHAATPVLLSNPEDAANSWGAWGASRSKSDAYGFDLAIGCDNLSWHTHTIPATLPELKLAMAQVIKLDWPDYGAPPIPFEWWIKLYNLMRDRHWKVLFTCTGGHGRTGTALALMLAIAQYVDPIATVRRIYCKRAVESKAQEDYIARFIQYMERGN